MSDAFKDKNRQSATYFGGFFVFVKKMTKVEKNPNKLIKTY